MVVGSADDREEGAADRVADAVMRVINSQGPAALPEGETGPASRVQRGAFVARRESATGSPQAGGDEPIGRDGGPVSHDVGQRIRRKSGGGQPLGGDVGEEMRTAFGRSFDDVRIHADGESSRISRSLGARAFTVGSDIFFGAGEHQPDSASGKHMLAHELAHVVADGGAVRRTPIIRRLPDRSKWLKKSQGNGGVATGLSSENDDESTTSDADAANEPADISLADSIAYESSLGRFLFNHPVARFAATAMIDRCVTALHGEFDEENAETQRKIVAQFGGDDVKSAGQVGTDFEQILAAMKEGNLREKMTMVYNVMLNGLKDEIKTIMSESAWEQAEERGFDVAALKKRKGQLWRPGTKDLYRDPGNPVDRKNYDTYEHRGTTRLKADEANTRTVDSLEGEGKFSIGLSPREKRVQFGDADVTGDEQVQWEEGGTRWKPNPKNKWVKKVQNKMHMPVVAGPSGTALRMWQLWEFLDKPVAATHWRAAILGYMLSGNDHSFHEMMMISKEYGTSYVKGTAAYRHIDPFSETELRKGAAVDGTFPDERAFGRRIRGGKMALVREETIDEAENLAINAGLSDGELYALTALLAYTDENPSGYKFMNNLGSGITLRPKFWKFIKEDKYLRPKWENAEFDIDQLAAEAAELTNFATSALEMVSSQAYAGSVYRGFRAFSVGKYKVGKVFTFKKFVSASTRRDKAAQFAQKGVAPKGVIVEIENHTGIDLNGISMQGSGEGEVLYKPGSKFEVTKAPVKVGKKSYEMSWKDVSPVKDTTEMAQDDSANVQLGNFTWDAEGERKEFDEKLNPPEVQQPFTVEYSTAEAGMPFPNGNVVQVGFLVQWPTSDDWSLDVTTDMLDSLFERGVEVTAQWCTVVGELVNMSPRAVFDGLDRAYRKHVGKPPSLLAAMNARLPPAVVDAKAGAGAPAPINVSSTPKTPPTINVSSTPKTPPAINVSSTAKTPPSINVSSKPPAVASTPGGAGVAEFDAANPFSGSSLVTPDGAEFGNVERLTMMGLASWETVMSQASIESVWALGATGRATFAAAAAEWLKQQPSDVLASITNTYNAYQ